MGYNWGKSVIAKARMLQARGYNILSTARTHVPVEEKNKDGWTKLGEKMIGYEIVADFIGRYVHAELPEVCDLTRACKYQ